MARTKDPNEREVPDGISLLEAWFRIQGRAPWPFQREAWEAFARGEEGVIHVPTGAGKTYAAFGGPLAALIDEGRNAAPGLRVLYITPLRALVRDIEQALAMAVTAVGSSALVESRTGDSSTKERARQRRRLPEVLVTTPESLALLIARDDARATLGAVSAVLVDEWHELVASKRGALLSLTLSRLRALSPSALTWGITATIADPAEAARALLPHGRAARVITSSMPRPVHLETLLPDLVDPFPWAGHMGLVMLPKVLARLNPNVSNLIFTNTRSQAERWFQALKEARPDWEGILALHHGSIAREAREAAEEGLKTGRTRIVVATSSLDLGVDFPAVEAVYQIGSPKGVARLVQRAGRSAHRPLATCVAICVPANSLELLEFAAARRALAAGKIERRQPAGPSLDVLVQHLVTCALGGGFTADEQFTEVRSADAFATLDRGDFDWCLRFVVAGGAVLDAYPNYRRVAEEDGFYSVKSRREATLHRMNIGTIVGDEQAELKLVRGKRLGFVDEAYVARLKPGDRFVFAGRTLALVKSQDLVATVKLSAGKAANVPAWQGRFLPLSAPLGDELRSLVGAVATGSVIEDPEVVAAAPILTQQLVLSLLPADDEILFETWTTADGSHLFVYPFAGRAVHEGLASLLALRLARRVRTTFSIAANDYGLLIVSGAPLDFRATLAANDFAATSLEFDLRETVDASQAAKRRFREIARVAGIVRQNFPGNARKGGRALHASASLLFDTLARFDPENLLIAQARREASEELAAGDDLAAALARMTGARWLWAALTRPSPFAFSLVVERIRAQVGSETLAERVERMKAAWILKEDQRERRRPNARRRIGRSDAGAGGLLAGKKNSDRGRPPLG